MENCNRHLRLLSFHLLLGALSQRLLVQETDIARTFPPQEESVNVSRQKGAMLHYENSLDLAEFFLSLWNWFLYL